GLESVSIRRIQGVGYDVLEFLRGRLRCKGVTKQIVGVIPKGLAPLVVLMDHHSKDESGKWFKREVNGRHLAIGTWTHPERLAFRHLDSSGTSCIPGNGCHLAIGTWTHPECFLVPGSGYHLAIGTWTHLECFFVPGSGRHLAIGTWTHLERLPFWVVGVTWPLALRLIRNVLRSGYFMYITWPLALGLIRNVLRSGYFMYVTWPLALGLIRNVLRSGYFMYVIWPLALGLIRNVRHSSG
ncbi:hypothetical protein Tco_0763747, partial [Tanacetum coccineum]